jgi:hypothetical protein
VSDTATDLDLLQQRIASAWSDRTSSKWRADNPACGQCSVTAVAVQRLVGGDILKTETDGGMHFYNRIGGARQDFTAAQFDAPPFYDDLPSTAEEALADTSAGQLDAMMAALR